MTDATSAGRGGGAGDPVVVVTGGAVFTSLIRMTRKCD